ncbi:MAG TPA: hypothetical protein VL588_04500, partial [Bdellovibrionota bacterium]|nr:hypothetical protein [Bdellovibrionota bacterium]
MKNGTRFCWGILLLFTAACQSQGAQLGGRTDNPPEVHDDFGDLPQIPADLFGGALSDNDLDSASAAIEDRLQQTSASLPDDPDARAAQVAVDLKQLPEVRNALVSSDKNITVQLRDGTPILILNQRRPEGAPAPVAPPPVAAAREELPTGDQALLINVENLGGAGTGRINDALSAKGYKITQSTGSLADLRTKVRDMDVLWMGTHGGVMKVNMIPDDDGSAVEIMAVGTGEQVVNPCEASADCKINRQDYRELRLLQTRYVDGGPGFWAITRGFVRKYWTFHPKSLAYVDGCSTGGTFRAAEGFRSDVLNVAHAGAFLGWDAVVTVGGAADVGGTFFDRVTGANKFVAPDPKQRP